MVSFEASWSRIREVLQINQLGLTRAPGTRPGPVDKAPPDVLNSCVKYARGGVGAGLARACRWLAPLPAPATRTDVLCKPCLGLAMLSATQSPRPTPHPLVSLRPSPDDSAVMPSSGLPLKVPSPAFPGLPRQRPPWSASAPRASSSASPSARPACSVAPALPAQPAPRCWPWGRATRRW